MHILIGLIVVVAALIFAPWLVAIAVGVMASYWAFGLIIFVLVACWVLAPQVVRMIRRQSFAAGGYCGSPDYKPGEILGRVSPVAPFSAPVAPAKPVAKSEAPSPVTRLSPCGACGEPIKKHSMYCPSCGGDPRAKK